MTSKWAPSLFKGRIGEAVVEAILSEFGYRVERSGYEQIHTGSARASPDLLVTDPRNGEQRYVEVKYRSARPTAVKLDANRINAYREHYPRTILAISSAWDGAIYCAQVEDLLLGNVDDLSTLSLLDECWKPIWHYFPLVKRGERLKHTWKELQSILSMYGSRQVLGRKDRKLWDEEYEALTRYLEESWDESLFEDGMTKPQTDKMTLEELWETARNINAVTLAEDLLNPSEENLIESLLMSQVVTRALDRRGEESLIINLEKLSEALGLNKEDRAGPGLALLIAGLFKDPFDEKFKPLAMRLVKELKDGVGEIYLMDQAVPLRDSEPIDLKTAIKFAINQCRIDR